MADQRVAFVAYSSRDEVIAETILAGVRHANSVPTQPIRFEPWAFNDIAGQTIVSPILEKISDSPFVVADITYLNLNVVYEIGFSVGSGKRVFLIRHSKTLGDKVVVQKVGIFDTLGYSEYVGFEDLKNRLTSHIQETPLPFRLNLDRKAPVYTVEPSITTTAATVVVSRLKKAGYRYRSFMPSEDSRLAASDAVRQVACSAGVVLLLQADNSEAAIVHNVRALFAAGLAHGMAKPTLILAPIGYEAPLDVRDEISGYRLPDDIADRIADFCPKITDHLQQADPSPIEAGGFCKVSASAIRPLRMK